METTTKYHTCSLCEATCGIEVEVAGDRIVSIRGDKRDPFSRGHICPKAAALQDVHADPDRLRHPVRRTAKGWERMGWDEAFDHVGARVNAIQAAHGADAVGVYLGNPTVHNYAAALYRTPFCEALGSKSVFSAASLDQLSHHVVASKMFGHQYLMPVPDIDRTQYFVMLGANPVVSNGSIMTVPDIKGRLKQLRARGGKVVTVDPRFTETSKMADQHLFIKPGTDALLVMSMINVLFDEKLTRPGRLAELAPGWESLEDDARPYSPESVAEFTGIDAEAVRALVRDFVQAESGVLYGRMGASVQEFGSLSQYLIMMFNVLTGNLDRPGGFMFTTPAANTLPHGPSGSFGQHHTSVRGLPDFGGFLPASTMAEEMLTEGAGRIRAMILVAGNPVLSAPNGPQLEGALKDLDFCVSIDLYITESNRHADIILPPTMGLERDHFDIAFNMLAIRNVAKYAAPAVAASEDARHDWEILVELARRFGEGASAGVRLKTALFHRMGPRRLLDLILRTSAHGGKLNPFKGLTLKKLESNVHGLDLGPLESVLPERLQTEDRRIDISREFFLGDLPRLQQFMEDTRGVPSERPLSLIGRRDIRSCNSWLHNSHRLVKGKKVCTAMMNPLDAAECGATTGDTVTIESRVGRIEIEVDVTEDIMPGVVSIPHGWGHHRKGTQWRTAEAHAGVSVNDLTDDQVVDPLSGSAVLNGIPVAVSLVAGAATDLEAGQMGAETATTASA